MHEFVWHFSILVIIFYESPVDSKPENFERIFPASQYNNAHQSLVILSSVSVTSTGRHYELAKFRLSRLPMWRARAASITSCESTVGCLFFWNLCTQLTTDGSPSVSNIVCFGKRRTYGHRILLFRFLSNATPGADKKMTCSWLKRVGTKYVPIVITTRLMTHVTSIPSLELFQWQWTVRERCARDMLYTTISSTLLV